MELHTAPDRKPFGDDPQILRFVTLAERAHEHLARLAADQRPAVGEPTAMGERFVDRDIARLVVLDEEDGVGDAVEKLNSRKRPSKDGGERRGRIAFVRCRRDCADFQFQAYVFIKNGEPRRANVVAERTARL